MYKFLNIPPFEHNFNTFKQFTVQNHSYDDTIVGKNLHKIKENGLSKTIHRPLPKNVVKECKHLNLWSNYE